MPKCGRKIYGYRYIQVWLEKTKGICRNPKTVLRIICKLWVAGRDEARRRCWKSCGQAIYCDTHLLNRNFDAEQPNKKWAADIFYISPTQGFLCLPVIQDLFDNRIVACKAGRRRACNLVCDTVRAALQKEAAVGSYTQQRLRASIYPTSILCPCLKIGHCAVCTMMQKALRQQRYG